MPYENQFGSKTAHSDVVKNPDVQAFLRRCEPLREPSQEEINRLTDLFQDPEFTTDPPNVNYVIASDGSFYHSSIDDRIPSIKVSYLKFSTVLIEMNDFQGLEDNETHLVDPFRVAHLQRNRDTLSLVLPLANFRLPSFSSVRQTFRYQVEQFLKCDDTRFTSDRSTSLLATLAELARLRPIAGVQPNCIRLHRCPEDDCDGVDIDLDLSQSEWSCPTCGNSLYISDCLRVWEGIDDLHPNQEPASRFMSYLEHLLPVHYVRFLRDVSPSELQGLGLMVDGPLAVFGNAAWLHGCIMRFYHEVREIQSARGLLPPVIIGLQKTGYVVDFMKLLDPHIPRNKILSLTDAFRYEHLGVQRSGNGFGAETYYGNDFVFKTDSGKLFVFGLPYPFQDKANTRDFAVEKSVVSNYSEITRALRLISDVETDLYRDAVVPIALAHRHTAISLRPGGRVLDIMGRNTRATESGCGS